MKFSIRDLLLVTLIVALAVGWCLREMQVRAELALVNRWRSAAGALEYLFESDGWDVEWERDLSQVRVSRPAGVHRSEQFGLNTDDFGPGTPMKDSLRSLP